MRHISEGGNLSCYNAQGVKTSYFNQDSATPNTCEKFCYRVQQKQCHCNTKPTFYIDLQQCAQGLCANVAANALPCLDESLINPLSITAEGFENRQCA